MTTLSEHVRSLRYTVLGENTCEDIADDIKELEDKLDGQSKLLKLIHDDLLLRAEVYPPSPGRADRVVNLSATLWNRLCDAVEPPK